MSRSSHRTLIANISSTHILSAEVNLWLQCSKNRSIALHCVRCSCSLSHAENGQLLEPWIPHRTTKSLAATERTARTPASSLLIILKQNKELLTSFSLNCSWPDSIFGRRAVISGRTSACSWLMIFKLFKALPMTGAVSTSRQDSILGIKAARIVALQRPGCSWPRHHRQLGLGNIHDKTLSLVAVQTGWNGLQHDRCSNFSSQIMH